MIYVFFDIHYFFFFKQKTAYEMRISDWSSDVCSSDLPPARLRQCAPDPRDRRARARCRGDGGLYRHRLTSSALFHYRSLYVRPGTDGSSWRDRKSVV